MCPQFHTELHNSTQYETTESIPCSGIPNPQEIPSALQTSSCCSLQNSAGKEGREARQSGAVCTFPIQSQFESAGAGAGSNSPPPVSLHFLLPPLFLLCFPCFLSFSSWLHRPQRDQYKMPLLHVGIVYSHAQHTHESSVPVKDTVKIHTLSRKQERLKHSRNPSTQETFNSATAKLFHCFKSPYQNTLL